MPPDQTKNHRVLHVESPTKPYQEHRHPVLAMRISLVCLAWSGVRLPGVTNHPIWLGLHSLTLLPIITGRGVKYTHNDIKHTTLLTDSRGPGLCVIPQERHQSLEVDTHPTRSAEYTGSRTLLAPATTTSEPASDCEYTCEAVKFGNDFLRMAGIVQMLHARKQSNDNYPYAHTKGV